MLREYFENGAFVFSNNVTDFLLLLAVECVFLDVMLKCGTEMIEQLTCCLILDKRSLHYVVYLFEEVSVIQRCLLQVSHTVKVD